MLKYLGFLFTLFILMSIPSFMIFRSGVTYASKEVPLARWIGTFSLGNLGESKDLIS